MKLRFVLVGLLCGWLSVSGSAETPLLTLPTLVLPPGATLLRAGSWGQGAKPSFPYRPTPVDPEKQYSVGQTTRFGAAGEVSLTAAHYGTQLAGLGWKKTFDGSFINGHSSVPSGFARRSTPWFVAGSIA